jgi:hypothetical protein
MTLTAQGSTLTCTALKVILVMPVIGIVRQAVRPLAAEWTAIAAALLA